MKRARKHIPLLERYAAALACLLPQEDRDFFRKTHSPAASVIARFEIDHITLFAFGGSDAWWNLDPKLKSVHREKSRRDTSIVAKAKRIDEAKWREFTRVGKKRPARISKWPRGRWPKQRRLT